MYVAVPGRRRTLFHCVFQLRYHVQSTVAQNFQFRAGLIRLCRLIRYSYIFTAHMSPTINESFVLQRFERGNAVKLHNGIMFHFYPELPHMVSFMHYHSTFSRVGAHQQWSSCTWQCHKCPWRPTAYFDRVTTFKAL